MPAQFILQQSPGGHYYFSVIAVNNQKILASALYDSKKSARDDIESVFTNAPIDSRYERRTSSFGHHYFVLKDANQQIIGKSESYSTKQAMENAISALRSIVSGEPITDEKDREKDSRQDLSVPKPINAEESTQIRYIQITPKDIFVSYSRSDQSSVKEITKKLSQDGFKYWFDKEDLLPGDEWEAKILEAIQNAQYVLVFLSPRSIAKKGYFQKEVKYILEQRKYRPSGQRYIIPILLEICDPPREFRDIQWLQYWEEEAYEKLKKALSE